MGIDGVRTPAKRIHRDLTGAKRRHSIACQCIHTVLQFNEAEICVSTFKRSRIFKGLNHR
jgi:hypothetical protein